MKSKVVKKDKKDMCSKNDYKNDSSVDDARFSVVHTDPRFARFPKVWTLSQNTGVKNCASAAFAMRSPEILPPRRRQKGALKSTSDSRACSLIHALRAKRMWTSEGVSRGGVQYHTLRCLL